MSAPSQPLDGPVSSIRRWRRGPPRVHAPGRGAGRRRRGGVGACAAGERPGRGGGSRGAGGRRRGAHQDRARRRRVELHVGQRQARRDGARRVRRRAADVRRVHDPRAGASSRSRSCSCTAAAGRAPTGWARPTGVRAGSSIWCRKATRSTSSIGRDTGARRCTPTCTAAFRRRRWCSRAWPAGSRRRARIRTSRPNQYQKNHTQWPGPGNVGSPDLDQLCAGLGGSYVVQAAASGRGAGGRASGWTRAAGRAGVARRPGRRRRPTPRPGRTTCSTWPGGRPARSCSTGSAPRSS